MNLDDAKRRILTYLQSVKRRPLLVDVQTKRDMSEIIDFFNVEGNNFVRTEQFCNADGYLKLDEIYSAVAKNKGNTFITELSGFLKLFGDVAAKNVLKVLVSSAISGHVVILTYQCRKYLYFSDPRISETGRIVIVDGQPDEVPDICFVEPSLSGAFPKVYQGVNKIGYIMEMCSSECAYISTDVQKSNFSESVFHISQFDNSYELLCDIDPRTGIVPQSVGSSEQWNYVLQKMGNEGNWDSVIRQYFVSETNLINALSSFSLFDRQKKWLYFVSILICGTDENEYLKLAVDNTQDSEGLLKSIFRTILTIDRSNSKFNFLYEQRKELISGLKNSLLESIDFCKVVTTKGEDAIYYLTDLTQPEKERIIYWLNTYGANYDSEILKSILTIVYPDLAAYLTKYNYRIDLLDNYFEQYKYQKVINHILPSFEATVDEQSTRLDFVSKLKTRPSIVDRLDVFDSRAFFVDALGVEYLGFIQTKCTEYELSTNITCARCELPSITSFNKEFVEILKDKGCQVSKIKDLDEIKHHGEDNFDYEKEKTPVYLIRELEIIDKLLKKIRADILGDQYSRAIIISDHGASRLAVLHETENVLSMATTGEHSGRCCQISEVEFKPDFAVEDNGFWILTNYDRFRGGRKANVEVHGGASLEEVTVPIIEITQRQTEIEAFITEDSKMLMLGAKEHAIIQLYAGVKSNSITIKIDGKYINANMTDEQYIFDVELKDYTKKGKYSFDIYNGNDVLATGQQFEIKKKGISEVNLFG